MPYSKTTWVSGDVIAAAKLNNIEDGVAANDTAIAGLAPYACEGTVEVEDSTIAITLNKKAAELYAAISVGRMLELTIGSDVTIVALLASKHGSGDEATYTFGFVNESGLVLGGRGIAATADVVLTATVPGD